MLEEYKSFIIRALINKEYLNSNIINELLSNTIEIKEGLYVSKTIIDESTYKVIISIVGKDIFINSSLTREYVNNSFDGFIKEIYIDEENDRFIRKNNSIYHSSKIIKNTILENEYSSKKSIKKEKIKGTTYTNINSFNDLFISKIKTKNLF